MPLTSLTRGQTHRRIAWIIAIATRLQSKEADYVTDTEMLTARSFYDEIMRDHPERWHAFDPNANAEAAYLAIGQELARRRGVEAF
jgi:hypothetical protein